MRDLTPVHLLPLSYVVSHSHASIERIADQRFAVAVLSTLYRHSTDIPGRSDTLKDGPAEHKRMSVDPKKFFKKALKGVREVATTTTTALGTVASEIAGSSVLQPNSPQAKVQTALESANKSRLVCFVNTRKPLRITYSCVFVDSSRVACITHSPSPMLNTSRFTILHVFSRPWRMRTGRIVSLTETQMATSREMRLSLHACRCP